MCAQVLTQFYLCHALVVLQCSAQMEMNWLQLGARRRHVTKPCEQSETRCSLIAEWVTRQGIVECGVEI